MVVVAPAPIDFAPSNPPTNAIPTRTCLVKAPFIRLTQIMCLVLNSVVLGGGTRAFNAQGLDYCIIVSISIEWNTLVNVQSGNKFFHMGG